MPGAYQAPRPAGGQVQDQIGAFGGGQLEDLRGQAPGGLQGLLGILKGQSPGGSYVDRPYINNPAYPGGTSVDSPYDRGVISPSAPGWGGGDNYQIETYGPRPGGDGGFMEPRYGPRGGPGLPYATFDAGGRSPQTLQAQWGALDPDAQQNYIRQYSAASPKMQASVRDAFYGPGGQPYGPEAGMGSPTLDRPMPQGGMGPAATAALARGGYETQPADLGGGAAGGVQNLMARQKAKLNDQVGRGGLAGGGVGGGAGTVRGGALGPSGPSPLLGTGFTGGNLSPSGGGLGPGPGMPGAGGVGGGGLQGLRSLASQRGRARAPSGFGGQEY
jgi:hypothetical protein